MNKANSLTVKEAAQHLGLSEQTLRVAMQQGAFPWGTVIYRKGRNLYVINRGRFEEREGKIDL